MAQVLPKEVVRWAGTRWFCCEFAVSSQAGTNPGMARRRRMASVRPGQSFKGRQFTAEVILWAVRWYLLFPISFSDLELMLRDPRCRYRTHHHLSLDPSLCT